MYESIVKNSLFSQQKQKDRVIFIEKSKGIYKIDEKVFFLLFILGTLIPYSQLILWISEVGFTPTQLINEIMASKLSLMAWLDVIIAAICLLLFIWVDSKNNQVSHTWLAVLATLSVGVSSGLPLYLYLRAKAKTKKQKVNS